MITRRSYPCWCLLAVLTFGITLGCGSDPESHTGNTESPPKISGPVSVGPGVRLFTGTAAVLESGEACTTEKDARTDRWCGFVAFSSAGLRNLFVLNVSQVLAGVPVTCDTPDPNCLLLTEDVGGNGTDWHPTFFAGDTLVYYDAALEPYAWRPGMAGGRLLAHRPDAMDLVFCTPASRGSAVMCLGLPDDQEEDAVVRATLYAGAADGESEPLLEPIDDVIAASEADGNGVRRFSYGFPESGYVAWSSREIADGPETLKLRKVDDPASQVTIASDVHAWDISADRTQWLWFSSVGPDGHGILQTAPFPDGSNPVDLVSDAVDFALARDDEVVALTGAGDLVSIHDFVRAPEQQRLLDRQVLAVLAMSNNAHIAYAKHSVASRVVDLFISSFDGARSCMLDTSVSVALRSIHFSPAQDGVLWAQSKQDGYDAYHSRLTDCSTLSLAPDISVLGWIGDGTAIFMDGFDSSTSSGSMRFRQVGTTGELDPEPPTLIADHVYTYASSGPALIYTVTDTERADGLYVRAFGAN